MSVYKITLPDGSSNLIEATEEFVEAHFPGQWELVTEEQIPDAPETQPPPKQQRRHVTRLAFRNRFTAAEKVAMSSTKSAIGHLLGAAGVVEAIYCLKAMETGLVPPTLNLEKVSEDCKGIDLVPQKAKERKVDVALSNSFGFGGTNASLVLRRV